MKKYRTIFAPTTISLLLLLCAGEVSGLNVGEKAASPGQINWLQGEGWTWTREAVDAQITQYIAINILPGTSAQDIANLKICEELGRRYNGRVKFFGILGHEMVADEEREKYQVTSIPVGLDPKFSVTGGFLPTESVALPFIALFEEDGKFLWRGDLVGFNVAFQEILDGNFDFETAEIRNSFFRRIDDAVQKQDYDTALVVLTEALEKFQNDEQFIAFKSYVYAEFKNDKTSALNTINEALGAQPGNVNFYNLKLRLLDPETDTEEIDKTYKAMIQNFGTDSHMMYNLARKLLMPDDENGLRLELGITAAQKAYENFDKFEFVARSLALELLGDAFVRAGRLDLAIAALEESYDLGAPVRDVTLCQKKLEKCRQNYAVGSSLPQKAEWIKKDQ